MAADPTVRYVGCDFSAVMIEQANQLNAPYVASGQTWFVLRTGPELPFADSSLDKLLTVNTLYFWDDPAAELAELRRVAWSIVTRSAVIHTHTSLLFLQHCCTR